jgi:hypothetical protein
MGIDPALAVTRRRGAEAVAELAAIPDSPALKPADEAIARPDGSNGDDGRAGFRRKIGRMPEQYRGGQHRLDLANASPAELLTFCVAVEMEADELLESADWYQRSAMANPTDYPSRAYGCPACPGFYGGAPELTEGRGALPPWRTARWRVSGVLRRHVRRVPEHCYRRCRIGFHQC